MADPSAPRTAGTNRRELIQLGLVTAAGLAFAPVLPTPRVVLFEFAIAGGSHYGLGKAAYRLRPGWPLDLRPQPGNPHDPFAVEVLMPPIGRMAGMKLGYVPRAASEVTARWLARGAVLEAAVTRKLGWYEGDDPPAGLVFTDMMDGDPILRLTLVG